MSGDSVGDLVAKLLPTVPPAIVFDKLSELPPWLRDAKEDLLYPVDAATAAAHGIHETTKTYWVKFVSADALLRALNASSPQCKEELRDLPLRVYVMPTASLHDARLVSDMVLGVEVLPVKVNITVHNGIDLYNKVSSYNIACGLLDDINDIRGTVESEASRLAALADPKVKHAEKMMALYHEAKAAYEAMPEKGTSNEQVKMMAALSRFSIAQEVARVTQDAAATMASLSRSLTKRVEEMEVEMRRPNFMGCGPPPEE